MPIYQRSHDLARVFVLTGVISIVAGLGAFDAAKAAVPVATLFSYTSEPGDYIGAGGSNTFTPENATISLSGKASFATISVNAGQEWWRIELAAPVGEKLQPGIYYNGERASFKTGRAPGLDISGDGRGCNEIWGNFSINQIATNSLGDVTMLDVSFTQRCEESTAPAMKGVVKFKAPALSYSFVSAPGDWVGGGMTQHYRGAESIFSLTGTDTNLWYAVSGKRDDWHATINAPTGQHLQVGSYNTARFADASHAGLDFTGNGRGCNMSSGTLNITTLAMNTQGKVISLGATFTQYCDGGPPLRGKIHYRD